MSTSWIVTVSAAEVSGMVFFWDARGGLQQETYAVVGEHASMSAQYP